MLGDIPHHSLNKLSQKYGPIMQLRLGLVPTVVVSTSEAAELFLKTHDINFASRPKILASEYLSYGSRGVGFSEYGPYWRSLRKLCTIYLLSISKIESFRPLRKEEVRNFIKRVGAAEGEGLTRRMKDANKTMDNFLEKIIDEHEQGTTGEQEHHKDFIAILLSLMKSNDGYEVKLDKTNIKAIIVDMLGAAMDTSATTIDWALAELLRHPHIMEKVQDELVNLVGLDRRRKCPGIEMGLKAVQLVLAQFVHCFDLELPHGMSPKDIDMKESFGIVVPRVPTLELMSNLMKGYAFNLSGCFGSRHS
ncbi:hypothetical protein IFM89_026676, partial [Coptis chinensis]